MDPLTLSSESENWEKFLYLPPVPTSPLLLSELPKFVHATARYWSHICHQNFHHCTERIRRTLAASRWCRHHCCSSGTTMFPLIEELKEGGEVVPQLYFPSLKNTNKEGKLYPNFSTTSICRHCYHPHSHSAIYEPGSLPVRENKGLSKHNQIQMGWCLFWLEGVY